DAVLLDVRRTFDEVVRGLAATPEQARAVLENRLYQNLSGTLAGTAEYTAVETVFRLAQDGGYDLLVVDTPPARHVVDFLDAPRRVLALRASPASAIPNAAARPARARRPAARRPRGATHGAPPARAWRARGARRTSGGRARPAGRARRGAGRRRSAAPRRRPRRP